MNKAEVVSYIESQKSLHLYKELQNAFIDVLSKLPKEQFERMRKYLIIMAFHEGTIGQVMHFEARNDNFAVMQLYIPKDIPNDVLRWVIAHELGHVMQGRNWQMHDGDKLEADATAFAKKIGYLKTKSINDWLTYKNSEK
ncbi:MAG: hypothetical protein H6793_02780 [Candidatus Nomurabacteria bacterium]|nr:hypothetical protein [Candidatus Saccharibacteria bacterium]USN95236.1 MAG: hypothetical protein H6793_02780 [Candidatus Nomurabacteria bacterium]